MEKITKHELWKALTEPSPDDQECDNCQHGGDDSEPCMMCEPIRSCTDEMIKEGYKDNWAWARQSKIFPKPEILTDKV